MTPSFLSNKAGKPKKKRITRRTLQYMWLVVMMVDQTVKFEIRQNFEVGESHPVIPGVFHITYVRNTGAAFSLFKSMPVMTMVLPSILLIAASVALYMLYKRNMIFPMFCVSLIVGGGAGNMADRVMQGFVVDMFDFRVFPVFNVADMAITIGCALLLIWAFRNEKDKDAENQEQTQ